MTMQELLFDVEAQETISIDDAAAQAMVSSATIRNWVKTGYLVQRGKGKIDSVSFRHFMNNTAGVTKLCSRANKLSKDTHNHELATDSLLSDIDEIAGEELSARYEASLSSSFRNKEGIFYTPSEIVGDILEKMELSPDTTFLDPSCGTGNFLMEAIRLGCKPENVYGFDTDPNAVIIAQKRIEEATGFRGDRIRCGDFLEAAASLIGQGKTFDRIATNPPWGKKISKEIRERYARIFHSGKSIDTSSLFTAAARTLLAREGLLGFLVQEAFFNIASFEDARKMLLKDTVIWCIDYDKPFKGVMAKAQAFVLRNTKPPTSSNIMCLHEGKKYERESSSFARNPKSIFNFYTTSDEAAAIDTIFQKTHTTLTGKARWALGIVTGNNEKYLSNAPKTGYLPIVKGSDIGKNTLRNPDTFIFHDFSLYQQVAPIEFYSAKEKIIYRFISRKLAFYHDKNRYYILNSANLFIPNEDVMVSMQQLCSLLNSDVMGWLFQKLFNTHKILRSDIETLPIHWEYFTAFEDFDEQHYCDYLQIIKGNDGTYRVKK